MRKTKSGFADAGQVIGRAMRALHPDADPYTKVQLAVDEVISAPDSAQVATTVRKVQLQLVSIAASPRFDARRHRAISQALRGLSLADRRGLPTSTRNRKA